MLFLRFKNERAAYTTETSYTSHHYGSALLMIQISYTIHFLLKYFLYNFVELKLLGYTSNLSFLLKPKIMQSQPTNCDFLLVISLCPTFF